MKENINIVSVQCAYLQGTGPELEPHGWGGGWEVGEQS
jgi:hypothetical protein